MPTTIEAERITIFLSEDDRHDHHDLAASLLERAREEGLAGATVWRGIEGFGTSGLVRTTRFPDTDLGLPLTVELIDRPDRLDAFLPVVLDLAPGSLVTREPVRLSRFSDTAPHGLDDPAPGTAAERS